MANVVEEQRILPDLPVVEDCDAIIMDDDDDIPCGGAGERAVTTTKPCVIMPVLAPAANAQDEETD